MNIFFFKIVSFKMHRCVALTGQHQTPHSFESCSPELDLCLYTKYVVIFYLYYETKP